MKSYSFNDGWHPFAKATRFCLKLLAWPFYAAWLMFFRYGNPYGACYADENGRQKNIKRWGHWDCPPNLNPLFALIDGSIADDAPPSSQPKQ